MTITLRCNKLVAEKLVELIGFLASYCNQFQYSVRHSPIEGRLVFEVWCVHLVCLFQITTRIQAAGVDWLTMQAKFGNAKDVISLLLQKIR